jgi:ectoine hydroxylase-related dioxygenase (phytanoyl-CoA dioxygenase family)
MLSYAVRARLSRARTHVERRLRETFLGSTPSWRRRPDVPPWFDAPDALAQVARRARSAEEAAYLERWVRDGWVVVDGCVDAGDVDAMVADLDGLWDAAEPVRGLEIIGLREDADAEPRVVPHHAVLARDPAVRRRMREISDWRIHGFHYVNAPARRLFRSPALRTLADRILGRRARPIAAINFMAGSQQALHQDMAVFHIYPRNFLLGAWIACEDIRAESGPLVLYSGSHRAPFFPGFTDYPQTNLRTADGETFRAYQEWVDRLAPGFERYEFHARKGQVLLWHGMLIHGGAPIARRGSSRKSMVIHYTVRGADRGREIRGPFNW